MLRRSSTVTVPVIALAIQRWAVSRNRYRWFGRSETCLLPPADAAWRFLD